jgi:hypothetical protein
VLYVSDMLNAWIYVCRVGLNKSLWFYGDVGKLHWLKLQEKDMHSKTSYPMWMGYVLWEVCEKGKLKMNWNKKSRSQFERIFQWELL